MLLNVKSHCANIAFVTKQSFKKTLSPLALLNNIFNLLISKAIQHSAIFEGFCGSINKQLVFKQVHGKTVVTNFPDRSNVIYSEKQRQAQKRFSDAVYFARTVIANANMKKIYALKASLYNFRAAWNAAIAEYMGDAPLSLKPAKERFDNKIITDEMGQDIHVKLFKRVSDSYSNVGILIGTPPGQVKRTSFKRRRSKLRGSTNILRMVLDKADLFK